MGPFDAAIFGDFAFIGSASTFPEPVPWEHGVDPKVGCERRSHRLETSWTTRIDANQGRHDLVAGFANAKLHSCPVGPPTPAGL